MGYTRQGRWGSNILHCSSDNARTKSTTTANELRQQCSFSFDRTATCTPNPSAAQDWKTRHSTVDRWDLGEREWERAGERERNSHGWQRLSTGYLYSSITDKVFVEKHWCRLTRADVVWRGHRAAVDAWLLMLWRQQVLVWESPALCSPHPLVRSGRNTRHLANEETLTGLSSAVWTLWAAHAQLPLFLLCYKEELNF